MPEKPEEMGAFFDRVAAGYDQVHTQMVYKDPSAFYAKVAQSIPKTNEVIQILDLGIGTGLELEAIFAKAPHARIIGIDLSAKMLELLSAKYANRKSQLYLIQGSYLDPLPEENKFDFCVSVMSMHHLLAEKKQVVYNNIFHALKPGGKYIEGDYIVSVDVAADEMERYEQALGDTSTTQDGIYHVDIPMTIEELTTMLLKAGFSTVEVLWQQQYNAIWVAEKK